MSHALTIVEPATLAPKKKREKICLIETQPEADWFVRLRPSEDGKCGTYASR